MNEKIISSNDVEELRELFAVPINLQPVKGFPDGETAYTNNSLKSKYVLSMLKTNRAKVLAPIIAKLVKDESIIPCFLSKGLLRYVLYKTLAPRATKSISGFYVPESKKIFLLIDNNVNLFCFASNNLLANLTIHEGMHMLADKKPSAFMSTFKSDLVNYYDSVFTEIFKLNGKQKKEIPKIVDFIFKIEKVLRLNNSTLEKYHKVLSQLKKYSLLNGYDFEETLRRVIIIIKIMWNNLNAFLSVQDKYRDILGPLYNAYSKTFGIRGLDTIAIQEFFTPSEVISIASESKSKLTPKIYAGFKKLV